VAALERLTEGVVAGAFGVVVACLWVLDPPRSFAVWPAAVCLGVLALATRVRFDIPLGFTVPTQVAFVPLLFAMPWCWSRSGWYWRCCLRGCPMSCAVRASQAGCC
jgi:hypothetical protein